ncbi:hypothetical protein BEL04_13730 [Mucilaginibacter sp. PPCGB 2223]|uniref:SusC/RagA family TonB-linked outer membrane protein n=1 Tax=Mucilaginibacter sp. PPCGB 2223 TaxID=1886027 RepID=UPI0008244D68|nr:SusC/RagA family TonB-linked outer membrane protein [Mucilaginibacter sp. PPCGB 2223]OCX52514.1 hypothetical protein BEL04_13730 [Mucilaginibacter sp. PPCGB 2223]
MKQKLLTILVLFAVGITSALAQSKTITGKVTGADDGLTLPGVSVKVQGTSMGTQTNAEGKFTVNVPATAKALIFSYLGYASQTVAIGSRTVIDVKLNPDTKALAEVVVVGYQTIKRSDVVGALSTVDGKDLEAKPLASFTQLLQGAATGLQVTAANGRPGSNAVIRLRGQGSITAGSDPLIVVDGIQITTAAYNGLNPDDIENVSVLKDAQATAIYGSRGSNGVIIVTTKTGKANAPSLRYSFRFGKTQRQDFNNVRLMTSAEKLQYEYDAQYTNPTLDSMITNRGYVVTPPFPGAPGSKINFITPAQRQTIWDLAISRGAGDWSKYLFQNATMRTHEISLSGGADKLTYYLSGDINDNPGVERFSEFNRKGGRLNVTYQVKDWFKVGTNIGVTSSHEQRVRDAYNTQNSQGALFFFNPYEQPYNADGSYNLTAQGFSPLEGAVNNPTLYDRVNQFGTFYGEAHFLNHLTLKSQYALNYNTLAYQSYLEPGSNLAGILGYNQKNDQNNTDYFYSWTNTANWVQTIDNKHTFNALIGTEYDKDHVYNSSLTGRGFPSKDFTTLDNAATPTTATTSITEFSLISYFASLSYDFDKRYFINVSGRRDGSSRFGANVRFANFGAIGLAWDIKNEKFLTLPNWVSELKLRGSYGTAGNNTIPEYTPYGTYSVTTKYNDQTALIPSKLSNPNLTWETGYTKDAGLTYGFLDGRITGELDWYNRVNKNLLYPVNVSQTTGFTSYTGNIGAVQNQGIELAINGAVIRKKDLKWNVSFSYSHNDNKITQLYSDNAAGQAAYGITKLVVGQPINVYFLMREKGVDPADGQEVYYNIDGTETKTYAGSQAVVLSGKSPIVKYFGTIGTDVSYKGFDFDARFYYSGGNWIFNVVDQDATSSGDVSTNLLSYAANYWKKPGDVVPFPRVLDPATGKPDTKQATEFFTDKYLQKGDYVTLRDVTLGYTVPGKYTKRLGIANIRVFAQGTNLATWTKFHGNPETGDAGETTTANGTLYQYGYPPIKGYTFGIDVRF